jgi:putative NADPH-quinone reductase
MIGRRRILIVNGNPDGRVDRLSAALCDAYAAGAEEMRRETRRVTVAKLDFPLLRTADAFAAPPDSPAILAAQEDFLWADHIVVVFPLWLGGAPALLKAFLEQVLRPGFALGAQGDKAITGLLKGRSVRLIVTMGMPAAIFRLVFGGFGVRALTRGVFMICGMLPARATVIGGVGSTDAKIHARWLALARRLGRRGI